MLNKKLTDDALQLYNGNIVFLEKDKKPSPPKNTAHGKELYVMAEYLYGLWLSADSSERDIEFLNKAVEYCRLAVNEGYPDAIVLMGFFYDKDYLELNRTEEFRSRVAFNYYSKIVYNDNPEKSDYAAEDWTRLQQKAAGMLLDMLYRWQSSTEKYNYESNKEKVRRKLGIIHEGKAVARSGRNRYEFVDKLLDSCKDKLRAPLFGVVSLEGTNAHDLFFGDIPVLKYGSSVNLWLYLPKDDSLSAENVQRIRNKQDFKDFIKEEESDGYKDISQGWMMFCNDCGGHKYINKAARGNLFEKLREDEYNLMKKFTKICSEKSKSGFVFYDDDMFYCMSKSHKKIDRAVEMLISSAENDEDLGEQDV